LKSVRKLVLLFVVIDSDQPAGDDADPQVLLLIQICGFISRVQNAAEQLPACAARGAAATANKHRIPVTPAVGKVARDMTLLFDTACWTAVDRASVDRSTPWTHS
jgi:hypothetical protein